MADNPLSSRSAGTGSDSDGSKEKHSPSSQVDEVTALIDDVWEDIGGPTSCSSTDEDNELIADGGICIESRKLLAKVEQQLQDHNEVPESAAEQVISAIRDECIDEAADRSVDRTAGEAEVSADEALDVVLDAARRECSRMTSLPGLHHEAGRLRAAIQRLAFAQVVLGRAPILLTPSNPSGEFEINYSATDDMGTYYDLPESAPCDAIIVDEVDNTVRFDGIEKPEDRLEVTKKLLHDQLHKLRSSCEVNTEATLDDRIDELQFAGLINDQEASWMRDAAQEAIQDAEGGEN
jgi:hypothetical protein